MCNYARGNYEEWTIIVQEEMSFKDVSLLELWLPFCSPEWNRFVKNGLVSQSKKKTNIFFGQQRAITLAAMG